MPFQEQMERKICTYIFEGIQPLKYILKFTIIWQMNGITLCYISQTKKEKYHISYHLYMKSASLVAQRLKRLPPMRETPDSIPGSGRSPGEGNGNPLQYSCLGNPMDRGAVSYTLWGHRVRPN